METMAEYEFSKQYDDMLAECYPEVEICGMKYQTSIALKKLDPIAYRCGMLDYAERICRRLK